MINNKKI